MVTGTIIDVVVILIFDLFLMAYLVIFKVLSSTQEGFLKKKRTIL